MSYWTRLQVISANKKKPPNHDLLPDGNWLDSERSMDRYQPYNRDTDSLKNSDSSRRNGDNCST